MHDLTVMFSVLFWSFVIGGVVGALLAVPLTAAIKVIFVRYVWSSYGTPSADVKDGSVHRE
jgi:predicted PurR-regulated permease PerM